MKYRQSLYCFWPKARKNAPWLSFVNVKFGQSKILNDHITCEDCSWIVISMFLCSVLFPDGLQQTSIEVVAGSHHSAALTGKFSFKALYICNISSPVLLQFLAPKWGIGPEMSCLHLSLFLATEVTATHVNMWINAGKCQGHVMPQLNRQQ